MGFKKLIFAMPFILLVGCGTDIAVNENHAPSSTNAASEVSDADLYAAIQPEVHGHHVMLNVSFLGGEQYFSSGGEIETAVVTDNNDPAAQPIPVMFEKADETSFHGEVIAPRPGTWTLTLTVKHGTRVKEFKSSFVVK
ncbi:hypothetical protein CBW65_03950 [Tumebacillus avium]|uniref:YtkA-like domain-containing protein n=1 Tax=Tumebacillus avium TaxID=1903704 RepID=A0A1Y0IJ25_9BACL|nr:hypothetical protein [Tumebacillus avium]ARU60310.1 hypothetical protein CBW65_03950 [Tumebacillus avium]